MNSYIQHKKINHFMDLTVWQVGHELVLMVCKVLKSFPNNEQYALADQMRRAVVSITSNIAEGCGRDTFKDKNRFFLIARGSLTEIQNHLIIAKDLGYISLDTYQKTSTLCNRVILLLQGLINKTKQYYT